MDTDLSNPQTFQRFHAGRDPLSLSDMRRQRQALHYLQVPCTGLVNKLHKYFNILFCSCQVYLLIFFEILAIILFPFLSLLHNFCTACFQFPLFSVKLPAFVSRPPRRWKRQSPHRLSAKAFCCGKIHPTRL